MSTSEVPFSSVVVHPLVLLSVVDHYNRTGKDQSKGQRVVGILLGSLKKGRILDVSNSFAVPFDEDPRDPDAWFFDHDYMEKTYHMFRKVNSRERIVGWYHTGPKLHRNDMKINDAVRKQCAHSVLIIVDVQPKEHGLPTDVYYAVEEVHDDGRPTSKTFEHLPSEIGAEEAEEVGVEHLLRDIRDSLNIGTLSQRISGQIRGLKGLETNLQEIAAYLSDVTSGRLPVNHEITYHLQDVFNGLPDTNAESFVRSMTVNSNDQMLVMYLAALVRSVIGLHNLIDNKLTSRDAEKEAAEKKEKDAAGQTASGDKTDTSGDKTEASADASKSKDAKTDGRSA